MKVKVSKIQPRKNITVSLSAESYDLLSLFAVVEHSDVEELSRRIIEDFCSFAAKHMLNEGVVS